MALKRAVLTLEELEVLRAQEAERARTYRFRLKVRLAIGDEEAYQAFRAKQNARAKSRKK